MDIHIGQTSALVLNLAAEGFNFEGELATIRDHLVEVETALGLEQAFKDEFATL